MKRKDPFLKPLDRGLFQFPDKPIIISNPSLGDIYQEPQTGVPYLFSGSDYQHGFWSPFVTLDTNGKIPNSMLPPASSSPVLTGRIITVDKDCVNATDTRVAGDKYDLAKPFKTIQAAVNAYVVGDLIKINKSSTDYVENVVCNVAIFLVLYLDNVTIDGGTGVTFKGTQSGGSFRFLLLNSSIKNTGNSGDVINTSCIEHMGGVSVLGLAGSFQANSSSVLSTNSHAIVTKGSNKSIYTHNLYVYGGASALAGTGSNNSVNAYNCLMMGGTGATVTATADAALFNSSLSGSTVGCVTSKTASIMYNKIISTNGKAIVITNTSTGNVCIKYNDIKSKLDVITFSTTSTGSIEISNNYIGLTDQLNNTILLTLTASAKYMIVDNTWNKAPSITSGVLINNSVTTDNRLINDPTGAFPLSVSFP